MWVLINGFFNPSANCVTINITQRKHTQHALTVSKSKIKTLEQGVEYVQK